MNILNKYYEIFDKSDFEYKQTLLSIESLIDKSEIGKFMELVIKCDSENKKVGIPEHKEGTYKDGYLVKELIIKT